MSILLAGNAGVVSEVDEARNLQVITTTPGYPTAGGWYSVTGRSGVAVIAAALATDTVLMSARFSASSIRKAYITQLHVSLTNVLAGAIGGVPGILGLQRFATATPSGGTAKTPSRLSATKGTATDMIDVRDSNSALTVTSVTFSDELAWTLTPTAATYINSIDWLVDFKAPIELVAGDGVCLRTRQVQPATATWYFTYEMYWYER